MTRTELLTFLRDPPWAVEAPVTPDAAPQAGFPDASARLAWPTLTHFRVRPTWVRFTDFRGAPPVEVVVQFPALRGGGAEP